MNRHTSSERKQGNKNLPTCKSIQSKPTNPSQNLHEHIFQSSASVNFSTEKDK